MPDRLYLKVRNWDKFQLYHNGGKSKNPGPLTWFPFYTTLFDQEEWVDLSDEGKLLLVAVWTLTARMGNGKLPANVRLIAKRASLNGALDLAELIVGRWVELVDYEGVPACDSPNKLVFADLYRDLFLLVENRQRQAQNRLEQAKLGTFSENVGESPRIVDQQRSKKESIRSSSSASSSRREPAADHGPIELDLLEKVEDQCGHEARRLLEAIGDWTQSTATRLILAKSRGACDADYADARSALRAKAGQVQNRGAYACRVIDERLERRKGA